MLERLLGVFGRIGLPFFEEVSTNSWRSMPEPPTPFVARGAGHDPDRVLLAGGSSAVGWGVLSHDLGLAGFLARETSTITGRGTDIEVIVDPKMTARRAISALPTGTVARFDAVVLTVSSRAAFRLQPVGEWIADLTALLDHLAGAIDPPPRVLVVGAEEVEPVPLPGLFRRIVRAKAEAINAATRAAIADRPDVRYVDSAWLPTDEQPNLVEADKLALYERAAIALAPTLAGILEAHGARVRHPIDETGRARSVEYLRSRLERGEDPRLTALLSTVREVLHVRSADLFFVDEDDVRLIAATNPTHGSKPRNETLSAETVEYWGGLVIDDLAADPRHRDRPEVAGEPYLRFYAGHPVEAPSGHRVAVLAVVDTAPRQMSASELSLLRHFAHRAGVLLFDRY